MRSPCSRVSEEAVKSRRARGRANFIAAYRRLERGLARSASTSNNFDLLLDVLAACLNLRCGEFSLSLQPLERGSPFPRTTAVVPVAPFLRRRARHRSS